MSRGWGPVCGRAPPPALRWHSRGAKIMFNQRSSRKHTQSGREDNVAKLREDTRIAQANYREMIVKARHDKAEHDEISLQKVYRDEAAQAVEALRNNWRDQ